jgi:hypothetical protein
LRVAADLFNVSIRDIVGRELVVPYIGCEADPRMLAMLRLKQILDADRMAAASPNPPAIPGLRYA